jgi:hypothetical protein
MASHVYHSFFERLGRGAGDLQGVAIKCALVGSGYTFSADHNFRDDFTANEVAATGGYATGGATVTGTVTDDAANDRVDIVLGAAQWAVSTITAYGAIYYVNTAGADSTDWLIAYLDFAGAKSSSGGNFDISASTIRLTPG